MLLIAAVILAKVEPERKRLKKMIDYYRRWNGTKICVYFPK